jgi:Ni,Fe-hydrogenase III large subunit
MEIERIAVHLDNLAEVGRLAASQTVWTRCGYLREILLRAADFSFGHRLMMDCVVPGGVASDIAEGGTKVILRALGSIASEIHAIRRLHEGAAVSSCLVGLGRASATLTAALGVSGIVGRASGSPFDIRNGFSPGYRDLMPIGGFATGATRPAKTQSQSVFSVTRLLGLAAMADPDARTRLASTTPHVRALHPSGDAAARQHLRIFEIQQSLGLIGMALDILPAGPVTVALPQVSGEGIAATESTRGDVWHWLRLDHGQIATAFVRDPGWALWPLAERVLEHASIEDIALIRASLALPASGMDL